MFTSTSDERHLKKNGLMNIASAEWTPLAGRMLGYCCLELHVYLPQHFEKVWKTLPIATIYFYYLPDTPSRQCYLCTLYCLCTNMCAQDAFSTKKPHWVSPGKTPHIHFTFFTTEMELKEVERQRIKCFLHLSHHLSKSENWYSRAIPNIFWGVQAKPFSTLFQMFLFISFIIS